MFDPTVQTIAFALLVVLLAVLSVTARSGTFLFTCGLLIPLFIPRLSIGIGFEWYRTIGPVALVLTVLRKWRGPTLPWTSPWLRMAAYAVVVSSLGMYFEYSSLQRYKLAAAVDLGAGQSYFKMPVQLLSFLGQLVVVFAVPAWARTEKDAWAGIRGIFAGCLLSVLAGAVAFVVTGRGTVTSHERLGELVLDDVSLSRLGGLSGEPKRLGACLLVVIAFCMAHYLFGTADESRRLRWPFWIFLAGLFATFSTSAWVGTIGVGLVAVGLAITRGRWARLVRLAPFAGILLLAVTSAGLVGEIFEKRFTDRLFGDASRVGRQKDNYVLQAMRDNPQNIPFGYGLGGGDLAALPYVSWEEAALKRTPTPGTVGVRMFGDLGLVGTALFVGTVLAGAARTFRSGTSAMGAFPLIGLGGVIFCSQIGLSAYLFLLGAATSIAAFSARSKLAEALENSPEVAPALPNVPAVVQSQEDLMTPQAGEARLPDSSGSGT